MVEIEATPFVAAANMTQTANVGNAAMVQTANVGGMEAEFQEEQYKGIDRAERINRYRAYVLSDNYPDSISVSKGHDRILLAASARFRFGIAKADALPVLEEYNAAKCDPRWSAKEVGHKLDQAHRGRFEAGEYLEKRPPSTAAVSVEPVEPDRPLRPDYVRPATLEVSKAIRGTPLETYLLEVKKINPRLSPEVILADAMLLGGLVLAKNRIRIGRDANDYEFVWGNFYILKLAGPSSGKGITSRFMVRMAEEMKLPRLYGDSIPAIIKQASKGASCGYMYIDEIRKLLDPASAMAKQVVNVMVGAFDTGRLSHFICPRGDEKSVLVPDAYPSLLVDGQPAVLEETCGKSNIDAGFLARFLVCLPPSLSQRMVKVGFPDMQAIINAYARYGAESDKIVTYDAYEPPSRAGQYEPYMTDHERAAWGRMGQYLLKIALLIEPSAIQTGRLSTEARDRAAVVLDWYYGNAIKVLGLVHEDRYELRRSRAVRYIGEHVGCSDRNLYRLLSCSMFEFTRDIAPTIIVRGDAHVIKGRWYPGTGTSDAYCGKA